MGILEAGGTQMMLPSSLSPSFLWRQGLAMQPRLAWDPRYSCFSFLNYTDVYHHILKVLHFRCELPSVYSDLESRFGI